MSLYDAVVPRFKQTLAALPAVIDKAIDFCETKKVDPSVLLNARLYPDMFPLHWQMESVILHSSAALASVETSSFSPQEARVSLNALPAIKTALQSALTKVEALDKARLDADANKEILLKFGSSSSPFSATGLLSSFSLPNFYFHASIGYALLRHNGVDIGKRDFLGQIQMK
jgi:hypothetical protein